MMMGPHNVCLTERVVGQLQAEFVWLRATLWTWS